MGESSDKLYVLPSSGADITAVFRCSERVVCAVGLIVVMQYVKKFMAHFCH